MEEQLKEEYKSGGKFQPFEFKTHQRPTNLKKIKSEVEL